MPGSPHVTIAEEVYNAESPTSVSRENRSGQRKVWLHLASSSASSSSTDLSATPSPGIALLRKRPDPLTSIEFLGSKSHATASSSCSASSSTTSSSSSSAASRFPFISPVEPLTTLARFHRSLNKVYIPLDEEEELEVGEKGFRSLNGKGSNFALLGTPGSSLLGAGAYGHVYKAIHFPTMRRVAIKKIPKDFGRANEFSNSFARELRNLYSNVRKITDEAKSARATQEEGPGGHCPFLLTLYDAYVEKNPTNLCLVLEYMEGGSLEQMMQQHPRDGCRDEGFLREVCHNVLKGLNYLHERQYLHQDVKPGNILLTLTHFAKLADFGLTVDVNSAADALGESYSAAVAVGSARYWPPELWGPTKRRDPEGKGDVWGLGLSIISLLCGKEPLHSCSTRSQVEIEVADAWKDAVDNKRSCRAAAEAKGIFSTEVLQGLSSSFQNFLSQCLRDLPDRPTAAELLQHRFIKMYNKGLSRRQRELDEAVQALKTHIQIHEEWKITPQMVELLARELRVPTSDLREYLEEHVEPGLMRSMGASTVADIEKGVVDIVTGAGEKEEEKEEGDEEEGEEEEKTEGGEGGDSEALGADSLQRNFLNYYDELDNLKTLVIPPLEELVRELRGQIMEKDAGLTEARKEIELLKQQLVRASVGLPMP